eukprot:SAG22_NODE_7900_length_699_cov_0.923333_1_plen_41_part_10
MQVVADAVDKEGVEVVGSVDEALAGLLIGDRPHVADDALDL